MAAATVTDLLNQVWKETGSDASELFNLQQIEMILREAAKVPNRVKLKNINVIDSGDGKSVAGVVNIYPEIFRQFLETVEHILGVKLSSK